MVSAHTERTFHQQPLPPGMHMPGAVRWTPRALSSKRGPHAATAPPPIKTSPTHTCYDTDTATDTATAHDCRLSQDRIYTTPGAIVGFSTHREDISPAATATRHAHARRSQVDPARAIKRGPPQQLHRHQSRQPTHTCYDTDTATAHACRAIDTTPGADVGFSTRRQDPAATLATPHKP